MHKLCLNLINSVYFSHQSCWILKINVQGHKDIIPQPLLQFGKQLGNLLQDEMDCGEPAGPEPHLPVINTIQAALATPSG